MDKEFLDKFKTAMKNNRGQFAYGVSLCRICNCTNGCGETTLVNKHGVTFLYTHGLIHYYEQHNVHPSKEFYKFIMDY